MRYSIVITDNKTGEVTENGNADVILLVTHTKDTTDTTIKSDCSCFSFAEAVAGLLALVKDIKKDEPKEFKLARKILKTRKKEND